MTVRRMMNSRRFQPEATVIGDVVFGRKPVVFPRDPLAMSREFPASYVQEQNLKETV
jgi:hypothetical protein